MLIFAKEGLSTIEDPRAGYLCRLEVNQMGEDGPDIR